MHTHNSASRQSELQGVERVFAELGLLSERKACERARARAGDTASARSSRPDAPASGSQERKLALACQLLAEAAPALAGDPILIARLVDRLEDVLGITRAQIARELIGRPELATLPRAFAVEALLVLVEGGERRLMRLGFDLHDGPLQELLLLAEDLRLFREQLIDVLAEHEERTLVCGRLEDLDARLVALEGGLRRISTAVHASVPIDQPFTDALGDIVDAFAARSEIAPVLLVAGDPSAMSPSQRIALLSVVGEALNNVREHARTARRVDIEIDFGADGVSARVVDDGRGFDVEHALVNAARRGRMGLAGIHERVRLLGGSCAVDSRPGGPTTVSLSLPRWEPLNTATATAGATPGPRRSGSAVPHRPSGPGVGLAV